MHRRPSNRLRGRSLMLSSGCLCGSTGRVSILKLIEQAVGDPEPMSELLFIDKTFSNDLFYSKQYGAWVSGPNEAEADRSAVDVSKGGRCIATSSDSHITDNLMDARSALSEVTIKKS